MQIYAASFWQHNRTALDKLFVPALCALSVPESCSAVEQVFSQGSIILCPDTARISDKLLSQLHVIVLKSNSVRAYILNYGLTSSLILWVICANSTAVFCCALCLSECPGMLATCKLSIKQTSYD